MNAQLDPGPLRFRSTGPDDIPLLFEWMRAPHAKRWFGGRYPTLEAIAIRAYEKAGFRFVREVTDEDGVSVHLMELGPGPLFFATSAG